MHSDFILELKKDYDNRQQELIILQNYVKKDNCTILSKCTVVLLYAHFEGFIKNSCQKMSLYIVEKVATTTLKLPKSYQYMLLTNHIPDGVTKINKKVDSIKNILTASDCFSLNEYNNATNIFKTIIDQVMASNLGYDNFKEILDKLGLSIDKLKITVDNTVKDEIMSKTNRIKNDIDDLKDMRNTIAHTGYFAVEINVIEKLFISIFSIMQQFIDIIDIYLTELFNHSNTI